jgi:hypothetical protein
MSLAASRGSVVRRLLVLVVAVLVAGPGSAVAADQHRLKSHGTISGHTAEAPGADGSFVVAGAVVDSRLGHGAIISVGKVDAATSTATGHFRSFFKHGTFRGTFHYAVTLHADGSFDITGTTHVTGGSGRYRHAHGRGTSSGAQDAQGYSVIDYHQHVRLPH